MTMLGSSSNSRKEDLRETEISSPSHKENDSKEEDPADDLPF